MKKDLGLILLSLFMALATIASNVGLLSASSVLISRAALHPDVLDLMVLIVAVRFFGIARGVFRYVERIISHDTTFKILSRLRKWIYKNFNDNYTESSKSYRAGDVYTKIVNHVDILKDYYLRVLYPFITAVLTGICTTIFLGCFSLKLALIYLSFYMASGFLLPMLIFLWNNANAEKEIKLKKEINMMLIDMINGILETDIYGLKDEFSSKFKRLSLESSNLQKKKSFINSIGDSIYSFSVTLLMAVALVAAQPLVISGQLQGIYYAMIPLAIMASFESLLPMPAILYRLNEVRTSGNDIITILGEKKKDEMKVKKMPKGFSLSVENLTVFKENSKEYILKDVSFELAKGKKLAIVGISGSGKSTVLKTLLGLISYEKGDIKLGEVSYSYLEKDEIRKYFTYIDQQPYIFNATLKENLLIADPCAGDTAVEEVLKKARILDLISEMSMGLETSLGQYGTRVSGGEKQRLAAARALLKPYKIILLDEPTASLDVAMEKELIASIHESIEDKSCVWVTHRLVSMERMDEIIVLNKGCVVERGTQEKLLELKGHYYRLWTMQQSRIDR
jgi:ATP-binding cassette subfamily C protein CydC